MTQRGCHLTGQEQCQRHLVKQRLESVMVLAVNQSDLNRLIRQGFRGIKTAEAAADDDNSMALRSFMQ
jgi:hypothetical protein